MPTIDVTFDDRDIRRGLASLQQRGADTTPAMREIAGHLVDCVAESFAREATPGGKAWTPLAEATIRDRRRKRYGAGPILEQSGDLVSRNCPGRASRLWSRSLGGIPLKARRVV